MKNKWKCVLKDGMVHINGKDYLFSKCTGYGVYTFHYPAFAIFLKFHVTENLNGNRDGLIFLVLHLNSYHAL